MNVTIAWTGYKNEGFNRLINAIHDNKEKQCIFKLDEDSLNGFDYVFDGIKINSLKINDIDERQHECTFNCTNENFRKIIKLIIGIKSLGDCGHSYNINFNGKNFSWDGDGCDRITKINGYDCNNVSSLENNYSKMVNAEKSISENFETMLNKILKEM